MTNRNVNVNVRFSAYGSSLERQMAQSAKLAKNLSGGIEGAARQALRLGAALGGVGAAAGYGIGRVAKEFVQLNREAENNVTSMATILQTLSNGGAGPFSNWNDALSQSNLLMKQFREQGALLPGTVEEFKNAFDLMLPRVSQTGASLKEVMDLSAKVVVVNAGRGAQATEFMARDINQILDRRSANNIQSPLLAGHAKALVKMAAKDRRATVLEISKILNISPEAMGMNAKSFEANFSTFQDGIKQMMTEAGKPTFDWVNTQFAEWNAWLDANKADVQEIIDSLWSPVFEAITGELGGWKESLSANKEQIKAIAKSIGEGIGKAIKTIINLVKNLYKNWDTIKEVIRTLAEVWMASRMVTAINSIVTAITGAGGLLAAVQGLATAAGPVLVAFLAIKTVVDSINEQGMFSNPAAAAAAAVGAKYNDGRSIAKAYLAGELPHELTQKIRNKVSFGLIKQQVDWGTGIRADVNSEIDPVKAGQVQSVSDSLVRITRQYADESRRAAIEAAQAKKQADGLKERREAQRKRNVEDLRAAIAGVRGHDAKSNALRAKYQARLDKILTAEDRALIPSKELKPGPTVDARGSTFNFNNRFDSGDPDRFYFEVRKEIITPFRPVISKSWG